VTFRLGNAVLSMTPMGLAPIEADLDNQIVIDFRIDGRSATLCLPGGLFERILELIDPLLVTVDLQDEMLLLLLEASIEDALLSVERALGGRIELLTIERGRALERRDLDLLFEMNIDGNQAGKVVLHLEEPVARKLVDALVKSPTTPLRYPDLKVELSLRTSVIWLDLGTLRSLKPGDILLADDETTEDEGIALTLGETWLLNVSYMDGELTLTQPLRRATNKDRDLWMMADSKNIDDDDEPLNDPLEEVQDGAENGGHRSQPRPDSDNSQSQATAPADEPPKEDATFDEVPIKLVFELGRQEISLGHLQELGPGHVFQLDRPISDAVDVFAGGRRVGQGEIVQVDDQVGVRMTRLFGHG
jgi:type III secretion protein Q